MSGLFSKPKMPDIPKQEAPIEDVKMVTEEAGAARRRRRKKLQVGGRESTKGYGIRSALMSALKKRLGE